MELLREHCEQLGVGFAINNAFSEGVVGAIDGQGYGAFIRRLFADRDEISVEAIPRFMKLIRYFLADRVEAYLYLLVLISMASVLFSFNLSLKTIGIPLSFLMINTNTFS